jgi:hypothetical protein
MQNAEVIAPGVVHQPVPQGPAPQAPFLANPLSGLLALAKMPPSFSGSLHESLTDWLVDFKNFALRMRLDERGCVDNLRALLTGPARTAYDEIATTLPDQEPWQHLEDALRQKFPEDRGLALREIEFINRMQKPDESPEIYVNALKELAKKVYRNAPPEVRNRHVISQFLRGLLSPAMRQHVVLTDKENPTIDDYVRRAMQFQLWAPNGAIAQKQDRHIDLTPLIAEVITKLSNNASTRQSELQNEQKPHTRSFLPTNHCGYCKSKGLAYRSHTESTCFRKQRPQTNMTKFCKFCQKEGHRTDDCYRLAEFHRRDGNANPRPPPPPRRQHQPAAMQTRSPPFYTTHPKPTMQPRQHSQQVSNLACRKCNGIGHFARDCPSYTMAVQNIPPYEPTAQPDGPFLFFFYTQDHDRTNTAHRTVVVTNLPNDQTQASLQLLGAIFGTIESIRIYHNTHTQTQTGFLVFETQQDAQKMLQHESVQLPTGKVRFEQPHRRTAMSRKRTSTVDNESNIIDNSKKPCIRTQSKSPSRSSISTKTTSMSTVSSIHLADHPSNSHREQSKSSTGPAPKIMAEPNETETDTIEKTIQKVLDRPQESTAHPTNPLRTTLFTPPKPLNTNADRQKPENEKKRHPMVARWAAKDKTKADKQESTTRKTVPTSHPKVKKPVQKHNQTEPSSQTDVTISPVVPDIFTIIEKLQKLISVDGSFQPTTNSEILNLLSALMAQPAPNLRPLQPLLSSLTLATTHDTPIHQKASILLERYNNLLDLGSTTSSNSKWYVIVYMFVNTITSFINFLQPCCRTPNTTNTTKTSNPVTRFAQRKTPSYLSYFRMLLEFFVILSLTTYTMADNHDNLTLNLCGASRSGYAVEIPKTIQCVLPDTMDYEEIHTPLELWLKRTTPYTANAYKCVLRTRTVCTFYSILWKLGPRTITSDKIENQPVPPVECRKAFETKTYNNQKLTERLPGLWTTNNVLNVEFKYCCYEHCNSASNLFIETGTVGTMDGVTLSSDLGDVGGCRSSSGQCTNSEGTILWDSSVLHTPCPYELSKTYNATISGPYVIIDSAQISLSVIRQTPTCGLGRAFHTAQGAIVRIPDNTPTHETIIHHWMHIHKPSTTPDIVNDTDPINAKLQYLQTILIKSQRTHFRTVWLELCRAAERHLHLIWQLLRIDPTLGARALTMQESIHAAFAGDALMIWQCRQVIPTHIYWNQTLNDKCYDYLPVEIDNETMFVVPGSRDVIAEAPPVSCAHHVSVVYYHANNRTNKTQWQSSSGPIHVAQVPLPVQWRGDWKLFTFDAPALFHDKLAELTNTFGLLRTYVHSQTVINAQIDRIMNYTAEHSFDPESVYQMLKGTGAAVATVIQGLGNTIENITSNHANALIGGADKLLSGPFRHIINVITVVLAITAIITLFYYLRRRNCCHITRPKRNRETAATFWNTITQKLNTLTSKHEDPTKQNLPTKVPDNDKENPQPHSYTMPQLGWNVVDSTLPQTSNITVTEQKIPSLTYAPHWFRPRKQTEYTFQVTIDEANYNHDTPWSHVTINGMPNALARWDTGASHTVISASLYNTLKAANVAYAIFPSQHVPMGACGTHLPVLGVTVIDLTFGDHTISVTALVVPNLPCPILLGTNLLYKYDKVTLDWKTGKIRLNDVVQVPIFGVTRPLAELNQTRNHQQITIPPEHETILNVRVLHPNGYSVLFEPTPVDSLLIARCIAIVKDGMIPIRACNPTKAPVTLYENMTIGEATVIQSSNLIATILPSTTSKTSPKYAQTQQRNHHDTTQQEFKEWLTKQKLNIPDHITETEKTDLMNRILKFPHLIARHDMDIGCTHLIKHHIDTGTNPPFRKQPYRIAPALRKEIERQVDQFMQTGIVEPSTSEYASPVLLVRKKSDSPEPVYRLVIDYRFLNRQSHFPNFPLPRIDDLLDAVNGAKYFTALDQTWAYLQVPLDDESKPKAAFVTHHGSFQPKRMFFGLSGAPATFARLMSRVLGRLQWTSCLAYLDDVLVFGKDLKEHNDRLEQVFQAFANAGLKLKLSKCCFLQDSITFLGHHISGSGIAPDPNKVKKILECPEPKNLKEVMSFNSLLSYYRRFIPNFAKKAAPLLNLLRKGTDFIWLTPHKQAFNDLKHALATQPVLAHPDFTKPWVLQTDGSFDGIGSVLSQIHDGKDHPVAYYSRTLKKAERNYSAWEIEALSIVSSLNHFRPYIYGQKITVITDNSALPAIFEKPSPNPRIARWGIVVQQYQITFKYRPGKQNNADPLSRPPFTNETTEIETPMSKLRWNAIEKLLAPDADRLPNRPGHKNTQEPQPIKTLENATSSLLFMIRTKPKIQPNQSLAELQSSTSLPQSDQEPENQKEIPPERTELIEEQKHDRFLGPIYVFHKLTQLRGPVDTYNPTVVKHAQMYTLQKDVLVTNTAQNKTSKIAIPESLIPKILYLHHDSTFAGHPGIKRTLKRINQHYHWPSLKKDVKNYVKKCLICSLHKPPHQYLNPPLNPIKPPSEPWHTVAVDIKGPLPISANGNRYIVSYICYLTKYVESIPTPDITTETIAHTFMHNIVLRHGPPVRLLSDRGRNLTAELLQRICQLCNTKKIFTSPYRPQGDGLIERYHRTLGTYLRIYTRGAPDWDEYVPYAAYAYNTTTQSSTDYSPFSLVYGRNPRTPTDEAYQYVARANTDANDYGNQVHRLLSESRQAALENLHVAQDAQKRYFDKKNTTIHTYQIGDFVLQKNAKYYFKSKKLSEPPWLGPKIIDDVRESTVKIRYPHEARKKAQWLHISHTTPYRTQTDSEAGIDDNVDPDYIAAHATDPEQTQRHTHRQSSNQQNVLQSGSKGTEQRQRTNRTPQQQLSKRYNLRPRH